MPKADAIETKAAAAPKPRVGKGWEAWLTGEWHPVEILKLVGEATAEVRWEWDNSVSEIWNHYVRPTPKAAPFSPEQGGPEAQRSSPSSPPPKAAAAVPVAAPSPAAKAAPKAAPKAPGPLAGITVGAAVEGLYGTRWNTAVVIRAVDAQGNVRVKWDYDGSEATLSAEEVRKTGGDEEVAGAGSPAAAKDNSAATMPAPPARPLKMPPPAPPTTLSPPRAAPPLQEVTAATAAQRVKDVRRILGLIPIDAPAEVRSYLQTLLPAETKTQSSTWL